METYGYSNVGIKKVGSIEEGHALLRDFILPLTNGGHNYAFLMERPDGTLEVEMRHGRPCWGETRRYKEKSNRPFDKWPSDLPTPIGIGSPIAAAMPLNLYGNTNSDVIETGLDITTSEESPYRTLFKDYELIRSDKNSVGYVFKDTGYDSTVQASMFMNLRNYLVSAHAFLKDLKDVSPALRFVIMTERAMFSQSGAYSDGWTSSVHPCWSMKRVIEGNPVGLSNGTWRDQKDYNRPFIHYLFSDYVADYPGALDVSVSHQEDQHKLNKEWAIKAETDPTTVHTLLKGVLDDLKVSDMTGLIAHGKEVEREVYNRV